MNVPNENPRLENPPRIIKLRTKLETALQQESWFNQETSNFDDLRKLLKGYSLPSFGRDEEPYSWILRGLEDLDFSLTWRMAEGIASFLKNVKPNQYILDSDDNKFLYNLFNICAGIRCSELIAEPLEQVFDYFWAEKNKNERNRIFADKRFYDIEGSFREALIANQISKKYLPVWQNILEQRVEFLSTQNPFNGFRGILFISENNQPLVNEIGWALGKMADYLYRVKDKKRHEKFPHLIKRVKEIWNSDKYNWDELLFRQAMDKKWQDWATVRLDKLLIPLAEPTNGLQHYFIWEIYLPFLEELKTEFRIISREGILLEIEASEQAVLFLEKISLKVENNRKGSSNRTYEGVKLASNEAFKELVRELKLNEKLETAKAIDRARFRVLTSKLPVSQQQTATEALVMVAAN
jgi:hypothetical protein